MPYCGSVTRIIVDVLVVVVVTDNVAVVVVVVVIVVAVVVVLVVIYLFVVILLLLVLVDWHPHLHHVAHPHRNISIYMGSRWFLLRGFAKARSFRNTSKVLPQKAGEASQKFWRDKTIRELVEGTRKAKI